MPLRIQSLDAAAAALLAGGRLWTVAARFERALILSRVPDGALISVVREDVADGPYTARLDAGGPRDLRTIGTAPELDVSSATRWATEPEVSDPVGTRELVRRLDILDLVAERAAPPGIGWSVVIPRRELEDLEDAVAAGDVCGASDVAARIAGLGPGLTPSGDDLIAGVLAFAAWARAAGFPAPDEAFRSLVAASAEPHTTRLAGQLLRASVGGGVAAPVAALLAAIFEKSSSFPPDLGCVLAIGATSGADTLAGIRLAARALRRCVSDQEAAAR